MNLKNRKNKTWTDAEDQFLQESVGSAKVQTIAKKLNRTIDAVETRMRIIGVDNTKFATGKLTASEFSGYVNVDSHSVVRWINKEGLSAIKKATRLEQKFWLIDVEGFWKWAETHKELIDFAKVEKGALLPEPDWFEEEARKNYKEIPRKRNQNWSPYEEDLLISMWKDGCSKKSIAGKLQRSEYAIQRKASKLKKERRLPLDKINLRWTKEETQMMLEMEMNGMTDEEIAYELGREKAHIFSRRLILRKNGMYDGLDIPHPTKYRYDEVDIEEMERLRKKAGITQRYICNKLGRSMSYYNQKVGKRTQFTIADIGQLAEILNTSKETLLKTKRL